jgi:hypothetical protein
VHAQKQPHWIGQKEKDGYMEDIISICDMIEAIMKSQGCSLMITRSKECIQSKLETHKQSQVI